MVRRMENDVDYGGKDSRRKDMTYRDFDAWLVEQARALPAPMNKFGTKQAQANSGTATGLENTYAGDATATQNEILPFLNQEVTNPQGFGVTGTNEMLTAGGQATSGALGAADEEAKLRASRMGNPSSSASILDAASRSAMKQQSSNALGVDTANLKEKLARQQAGASGISALSSADTKAALDALGLNNQSVQDWTGAYNATNPLNMITGILGNVGTLGQGVGAAAKAFSHNGR